MCRKFDILMIKHWRQYTNKIAVLPFTTVASSTIKVNLLGNPELISYFEVVSKKAALINGSGDHQC